MVVLAFAACTLSAACADMVGAGPGDPVFDYVLVTVNGAALPALANRTTDALGKVNYFIAAAAITLDSARRTFENRYLLVQTRGLSVPQLLPPPGDYQTDRGTWSLADTVVTLQYDDGSRDVGNVSVSFGSLTFTSKMSDGTPITYVYKLTTTGRPPVTVSISPDSAVIAVGKQVIFAATIKNGPFDTPVGWSTSAPNIAVVSPSGVVTGVSPGVATVTAVYAGVSASAKITVTP